MCCACSFLQSGGLVCLATLGGSCLHSGGSWRLGVPSLTLYVKFLELPFHTDHAAEEEKKEVAEKEANEENEEKEKKGKEKKGKKENQVHKPVRTGQGAKTELRVVLEVCSKEEWSVGLEERCPRLHYIIYTVGRAPGSREPCTCGINRGRIGR